MSLGDGAKSFWTTLSGLSTGVAALVTAGTTLYVTLIRGPSAPTQEAAQVSPANQMSAATHPGNSTVALPPPAGDEKAIRPPVPAEPPPGRSVDKPSLPDNPAHTKPGKADSEVRAVTGDETKSEPAAKTKDETIRPSAEPARDRSSSAPPPPPTAPVPDKRPNADAASGTPKESKTDRQTKVPAKEQRPPTTPPPTAKTESVEGEYWLTHSAKELQNGRLLVSAQCASPTGGPRRATVSIQEAGKPPIVSQDVAQGRMVKFNLGSEKYELRVLDIDATRARVRVNIIRTR